MDGVTQRLQRFQWFQRLQQLQPRTWRKLIILLMLLALVDGCLLTRAYVARNADTVVILVTEYNNATLSVLEHTTLRYTDDTAHQIQSAIDTYPFLVPGYRGPGDVCTPGDSGRTYDYQFTFLLAGVSVEVAATTSGGCVWSRTVLGLPERATIAEATGVVEPLITIYQLTNGALPT